MNDRGSALRSPYPSKVDTYKDEVKIYLRVSVFVIEKGLLIFPNI